MVILAVVLVLTIIKAPLGKDSDGKERGYSPNNFKGESASSPEADSDFFDYVNLGNQHSQHYEWDQALACFQAAVKIKPSEASIHFKIGRIYTQKEDYPHALTAFKNVLAIQSEHLEAMFELARILMLQGKLDDAQRLLSPILEKNPNHEDALRLKAQLYEKQGLYLNALPLLQKLMQVGKYAHHRKSRMQYADMLILAGMPDEAIQEYQVLIEKDSMNKALYEAKVAHLYFEQGHFGKAVEFYRRIFYSDDALREDIQIKHRMAASLCNEGVRHFNELGDTQSAIRFYKEALKYDDQNQDIHYNLGKAYLAIHQYENARKSFEAALNLMPDDTACAYELAVLADQQSNLDSAITYYQKVLKSDPHHTMAAYGLGALYGIEGELDKAIDYLSLAIRLNPGFEDAIYNLGVALERKNQPNKAIQMYRKVLSINNTHEQAKSNLAHLQHSRI